jgi:hypothetical protein
MTEISIQNASGEDIENGETIEVIAPPPTSITLK